METGYFNFYGIGDYMTLIKTDASKITFADGSLAHGILRIKPNNSFLCGHQFIAATLVEITFREGVFKNPLDLAYTPEGFYYDVQWLFGNADEPWRSQMQWHIPEVDSIELCEILDKCLNNHEHNHEVPQLKNQLAQSIQQAREAISEGQVLREENDILKEKLNLVSPDVAEEIRTIRQAARGEK